MLPGGQDVGKVQEKDHLNRLHLISPQVVLPTVTASPIPAPEAAGNLQEASVTPQPVASHTVPAAGSFSVFNEIG